MLFHFPPIYEKDITNLDLAYSQQTVGPDLHRSSLLSPSEVWCSVIGVRDSTDAFVVSETALFDMYKGYVVDIYTDGLNWDVLTEDTSVAVGIKVDVWHWFKSVTHCPS